MNEWMLPPDTISVLEMYQKCFCGRGSAPHPAQGAHSAPPDLLAEFPGPLYDRAGREREGKVVERVERGGEREKGRGPGAVLLWTDASACSQRLTFYCTRTFYHRRKAFRCLMQLFSYLSYI